MKMLTVLFVASFSVLGSAFAQLPAERQLARDIFQELININTSDSVGDNTRAANAMAVRFKAAGFADADVKVLEPAPRKGNLVVRLRGRGAGKPILFLAHLDVVEARREDWSFDPFEFRELNGYFYGRGTSDDKDGDTMLVTSFLRLKKEGFQPDRDLILALTSGEESGVDNGVDWLLKDHHDLVDAEFCVNTDSGGGEIRNGKRVAFFVQAAEKGYQSFQLEVKNAGGHSSLPIPDNAIYRLAQALTRVRDITFPVHLNEVTRGYLERMSQIETGQLASDLKVATAADPLPGPISRLSKTAFYNAVLRTTCVATMLSGGHAENALPQTATATVNCRLVPGDTAQMVEKAMKQAIRDPEVVITALVHASPAPFSPLSPGVMAVIEAAANSLWPGIPTVPLMETGATDGRYLRMEGTAVYGVSGVFDDLNDVRAHGKDERVPVESFYEGIEFYYRLVKGLGASAAK